MTLAIQNLLSWLPHKDREEVQKLIDENVDLKRRLRPFETAMALLAVDGNQASLHPGFVMLTNTEFEKMVQKEASLTAEVARLQTAFTGRMKTLVR